MHGHGRHRMLRLIALTILLQGPKNGVEIMREMEKRLGWLPSPGSIYPVLAQLAEENYIQKMDDGKYVLTPSGKLYSGGPPLWLSSVPVALEALDLITNYLYAEKSNGELSPYLDRLREIIGRLEILAG
ncbi:MAG: PadR family transcriptional regulator [Conexivisphaerales archaeon]